MADPDAAEPEPSEMPPSTGEAPAHLLVYVDGASSGNPGPCGAACVVKTPDGETVLDRARAFGPATNNVAEYQALLLGLETAATLRPRRLTIRSDSQLLVRQVAGQYKVKSPHLKPLHRQVRALLEPFETVEIQHVRRDANKEADALARKALEKSREVDADLPPEARRHAPPTSYRLK
jgi:ribonuclease HI